jgi:predicted Zn-dependent protease
MDTMMKSGFSKPQEFEADNAALKILAATGYDPGGLLEMLKVLEGVQRGRPGGFNSTHPTPAERVANASQQLAQYRVPDTRSFRAARFRNK